MTFFFTPFYIYTVMFILWYTNNKTDKLQFCCTRHSVRPFFSQQILRRH